MSIEFEDNSARITAELNEKTAAFLEEAAGELEAQTKRNTTSLGGHKWFAQIAGAWTHKVDDAKGEAVVGNPLQAALWTEFGTGEYAVHKDGRKGYWVYVKNDGNPDAAVKGGKTYTLEEARKIVAMMRKKGLDAHYTKGQRPKRALENAFNACKEPLKRRLEEILKGLGT